MDVFFNRQTNGYKLCSPSLQLVLLFIKGRLHTSASQEKRKEAKKLAQCFNVTLRYIYAVLSLDNSRFGEFVDRIYPIELEIKDATDTDMSASCHGIHLKIDREGRLRRQQKR